MGLNMDDGMAEEEEVGEAYASVIVIDNKQYETRKILYSKHDVCEFVLRC